MKYQIPLLALTLCPCCADKASRIQHKAKASPLSPSVSLSSTKSRGILPLFAIFSSIVICSSVYSQTKEETFQKYGEKYLAAKADGDLGTAFDMLLKADAAMPNPTCKAEAVILVYNALTENPRTGKTYEDLDAHLAKGYSEEWLRRALSCPIPDGEASGVQHWDYGLIAMTLGFHYNNVNRDVDKAAGAMALSEKHMKIACENDEEIKAACEQAGLRNNYRSLRAQLDKNRVALAYERARGTFKAFNDFTTKYAPETESVAPSDNQTKKSVARDSSTELSRFHNIFKNTYTTFTVVNADITLAMDVTLLLKHPDTGKKFSIKYDKAFSKGLADKKRLQPGDSIEVKFNGSGEPTSAKNPATGLAVGVSTYKVSGFGW